jgi:hypothetical protein
MTIVTAPWVIDFGKCYLDTVPPYDRKKLLEQARKMQREFGDNYSRLAGILWKLKSYGIHYVDAKPSNICFSAKDIDEEYDSDEDQHVDFDVYSEDNEDPSIE